MNQPEHLDPSRIPPWLMDHAKLQPESMGWLAAGYFAGVDVGRKTSPCPATATGPDGTLACGLALGHIGAHSTVAPVTWTDSAPSGPGADVASPPPG